MRKEYARVEAPETLHRQVHPSWLVEGHPSSQAFTPTPKDAGQLSVSRHKLADAQESYKRHAARGLETVGTWSLELSEVASVELSACEDPIVDDDPAVADDAHAFVDFRAISRSKAEKVGKRLKAFAVARGCTFSPK